MKTQILKLHIQCIELAVMMNFIRYIKTGKDMCTFFLLGVSAIRSRDSLCEPSLTRMLFAHVRNRNRKIKQDPHRKKQDKSRKVGKVLKY